MALVEVQHDDGTMLRAGDWPAFRRHHRLPDFPLLTIADVIAYRRRHERQVEHVIDAALPTPWGPARVSVWRDTITGQDHLALIFGRLDGTEPVLTRVHSQCFTGDVLGSLRCDCGAQLDAALTRIAAAGRGVLIYTLGHEGRGIGLANKIAAYALQDTTGADTVEANLALGLPVDARSYHVPGQILTGLGVSAIRLLTNNPAKTAGLAGHVHVAAREPLQIHPTVDNRRYLQAKADRLGHDLAPQPLPATASARATSTVPDSTGPGGTHPATARPDTAGPL